MSYQSAIEKILTCNLHATVGPQGFGPYNFLVSIPALAGDAASWPFTSTDTLKRLHGVARRQRCSSGARLLRKRAP